MNIYIIVSNKNEMTAVVVKFAFTAKVFFPCNACQRYHRVSKVCPTITQGERCV